MLTGSFVSVTVLSRSVLGRSVLGAAVLDPPAPDDTATEKASHLFVTLIAIVAAVVVAYLVATMVSIVVRRIGRRSAMARDIAKRLRRPDRAILMVVATWIAIAVTTDASQEWRSPVEHLLEVALIVSGAWWVGALAFVLEDSVLTRYRVDSVDNRHARRIRTQITVIRRLTVAVIVVCGIAGVLLTFPAARAAGASILASAGLISVIAGLAAQTSLANVFAGMQIVFTDAIRVDDVVVLEGQWGRIEEITLTYVVVHLWDDRRLILPSTFFTTTPYENWTRTASQLLGTVELDLDFRAPLGGMRTELERLLGRTELWDERVGILQVTDAVTGYARVRALVSAKDAPSLFDLRCYVREGLVDWLQREAPYALPQHRLLGIEDDRLLHRPEDEDEGADAERAEAVRPAEPAQPAGPALPAEAPRRAKDARRVEADTPARRGKQASPAVPPDVLPVTGRRGPVRVSAMKTPTPTPSAASERQRGDTAETVLLQPVHAPPEEVEGTADDPARSALFTGSPEARERSKQFEGPGQDVLDERRRAADQGAARSRGSDVETGDTRIVAAAEGEPAGPESAGPESAGPEPGPEPAGNGDAPAGGADPDDADTADPEAADRPGSGSTEARSE